MIDDADTADELSARIDLAASDQLDDETAQAYTDSVGELVNATSEGFEVISEGRTTLAARRAVIPYVIHNDQNIAMTIDVFYSSDKLRFPDGNQRTVTLQPGDNQLGVSVETVGSGDARVLVDLASPDGLLELGSGSIAIRSTAISGLGLVIGAIALLVLGAWWIRTIVRVRRARKGATVAGDANVDHDDVDSADTDSPNTIDADPQGDP
jgi:hypothetical protein